MRFRIRTGPAALLVAGVALSGCSDSPTTVPPFEVASVEVAPTNRSLGVGDTLWLTAYPRTAEGIVLGSVEVAWWPAGDAVAVEARGHRALVRARRAGIARVEASSEGKTGSTAITVTPLPQSVAGIEVVPGAARMAVNASLRLEAVVRGANGEVVGGRTIHWRSSDGPTATVHADAGTAFGIVTAQRAGPVVIYAAVDSFEAAVPITVEPAAPAVAAVLVSPSTRSIWRGATYGFGARVLSSSGEVLTDRIVTWAMEDSTVATVNPYGVVQGVGAGTTRVFARAGGAVGWAAVRVVPEPAGVMVFDLLPNVTASGAPWPTAVIGTTTWTDAGGVEHPAQRWLVGGLLEMDLDSGTYRQLLEVYLVADDAGGGTAVVGAERLSDDGDITYDAWTGARLLVSSTHQGLVLLPAYLEAALLSVPQAVGSGPVVSYVYRLR